jgi:nicotinamide mononucleotide transporter
MSWTEIFGFVSGALSVALAVRENVWNWPVGIVNNVFFFLLFWKSKLYADAGLQIVYAIISIFGWWNWIYGGVSRSKLAIAKTIRRTAPLLFVATVLSTMLLTLLLRTFTDSAVPFWDGLTTALSLTAQYMLSRKLIENWWVWMIADVVYIALYCYKSLFLTSFLYAIFFAMCIAGYFGWRKVLDRTALQQSEPVI